MNYQEYANKKITLNKYKGKTFEELAFEVLNNDKKYLSIIYKTLNTEKTPLDKKNEIQNFLNYFLNYYEPNHQPQTSILVPEVPEVKEVNIWIPPINTIKYDKKITHIIHISDIHIRLYSRSKEYQDVFQKLYNFIEGSKQINPNQIIVITGDLLHSKNTLSPECIITTQNFLMKLSSFLPTILIAGNHDALLTNNQREDSITAIVDKLLIPNFYYLKNSGVYLFSNIAFAVNSLLDNKWIFAKSFDVGYPITHKIALYHGGVGLCDTGVGHRLRGEKLVEDFDGYDYALLGDIHKFQFMDEDQNRIAYASSLIAQNFNEWNSPHGVLHWDLFNKNHIYYPIENEFGFFVFNLTNNQIFIENNLISEDSIGSYLQKSSMNIKLNIQGCNTEFVSRINYLVKQYCKDVKIIHNYLGAKTKEIQPEINIDSNSLLTQFIQKNNPNISQLEIQFILEKYHEYAQDVEIINEQHLSRWELIDLEFSNLFGYGSNNYIDFSRFTSDNPIGIIAPNSHGKSSLIDIILLTLFTKFSRSRGTGISKDIINVNCNTFYSKLRFKIGSDIYVIIKEGKREQTDKIKIHKNEFYKTQPNQTLILLTDEDRKKTDKIISELIGTYDDFIFTNVQLQSRTNSFKEMTDKERKEYLYKVLKLNIWNDVAKKVSENTKPLKNQINYLEKTIERKSIEEMSDKVQEIEVDIEEIQDKIEQQLYEKQINNENLENERIKLIPNIASEKYDENDIIEKLSDSNKMISTLDQQIQNIQKNNYNKTFQFIPIKDQIIEAYNKKKLGIEKNILELEKELKKLVFKALIPTSNLWNKISKKGNPEIIKKSLEENIDALNNSNLSDELEELEEELDNQNDKIESIQTELQNLKNEKIINQNKIHQINEEKIVVQSDISELKSKLKLKIKEKDVVQNKINNFQSELENPIYSTLEKEELLHKTLQNKLQEEKDLSNLLKNLENHEYDPNCKFCMKHPIVKQKEEKIIQLKELEKEIRNLKKSITIQDIKETQNNLQEIKSKLLEKQNKLIVLESTIAKIELDIEKVSNQQEKLNDINKKKSENEIINKKIQLLVSQLSDKTKELGLEEKQLKNLQNQRNDLLESINNNNLSLQKLESQLEIIQEIIEIDHKNKVIEEENLKIEYFKNEIDEIFTDFNQSEISIDYNNLQEEIQSEMKFKLESLQNENKIQSLLFQQKNIQSQIIEFEKILEEINNSRSAHIYNTNIRVNIELLLGKISKNEILIAKLNEKLGVSYQQFKDILNEQKLFLQQLDELKIKRNEYKLMQILEQSMGKDGLPLTILENYLVPITQSINNIIAPFISRKINLHIDNDDLILDSFPDNNEKSVYIHGGMESFILDIAFKITLSNFAKLPKCDILFLDEGISAFDSERLSNIDTLFNFIKKYFSKTILITHIDSVKESIIEKIGIVKENNFSKIVCEYAN